MTKKTFASEKKPSQTAQRISASLFVSTVISKLNVYFQHLREKVAPTNFQHKSSTCTKKDLLQTFQASEIISQCLLQQNFNNVQVIKTANILVIIPPPHK